MGLAMTGSPKDSRSVDTKRFLPWLPQSIDYNGDAIFSNLTVLLRAPVFPREMPPKGPESGG